MSWKITIHNEVPRVGRYQHADVLWKKWDYTTYAVNGKCWDVSGIPRKKFKQGSTDNESISSSGNRMFEPVDLVFETGTRNDVFACMMCEKTLHIVIHFYRESGEKIFSHELVLRVKPGGPFSRYHYYVHDKNVGESYWENLSFETVMRMKSSSECTIETEKA